MIIDIILLWINIVIIIITIIIIIMIISIFYPPLGCDVVSSAPYCDPDPKENIRIVFELAREFNCPVDLHLGDK